LEAVARETGFCKRGSKVNPYVFFDLLMYDTGSGKSNSLSQLAIEVKSEHGIGVSKQGLDKRFNDYTLAFLKKLIEKQLSVELGSQINAGWMGAFNRVTIKDGTRFSLPEAYKDFLPGSGGSGSMAGACLQFEFDFKNGRLIDLALTPANRPDVKDAQETGNNVRAGDLVLRDLGYYSFNSLENIINKSAFLISRLGSKTNVFEEKKGEYIKLDFKTIYNKMKKGHLSSIYKKVFLGTSQQIPVRLMIELMPDEVYEERMRKIKKLHQKKGYQTSELYKLLSRFNLFITNVPEDVLPDKVISSLYRIRWQVELIFKILKSVLGIHHIRKMKYKRWLILLHFRILMMIVNWNLIMAHRNFSYKLQGRLLSLNKCFKTLSGHSNRLRDAIKKGSKGMSKFIKWVVDILSEKHWLESKNKTLGIEKICHLFYCKSNVYAYI
jgi:hypothetical protein